MSLVVAPGTPYVVPEILRSAPTGISWSSLPWRAATDAEQLAEQLNICARATAMIDGYCHQPIRATVDTERIVGPGRGRMALQDNGTTRLAMSRWPVVTVLGARVTPARAFPPTWTTIDSGLLRPKDAILGAYGTSAPSTAGDGSPIVLLGPGVVTTQTRPRSLEMEITYINGWPHGSLTSAVAAGATSLRVDDITGWDSAAGVVYDVGLQETIMVTDVTPTTAGAVSGPGTLTLATALTSAHAAGTLVTTLPGTIMWAATLLCVAQALARGATATTVQNQPGAAAKAGGGVQAAREDAYRLLAPYRRVL